MPVRMKQIVALTLVHLELIFFAVRPNSGFNSTLLSNLD